MSQRISKDDYYLNIALEVSKRSNCLKRHYGCVIVKDDEIIATGYNGSPRGEINCCDIGKCDRMNIERNSGKYDECNSVHAEQNALLSARRRDMIGATMYLACEGYILDKESSQRNEEDIFRWMEDKSYHVVPCPICRRMIKNAGIDKVINRFVSEARNGNNR